MYTDFNAKTVLITGASAGIGEACAKIFAKSGANLILTARREDRLKELAFSLENEYSITALAVGLDVRNSQLVDEMIWGLPKEMQDIDLLVNNAGLVIGVEKAHETPESDIDTMFDTNVKGILNLIRAVVPSMLIRDMGQVINISSIAGHEAYPGGSIYCGTKHAVDAITKSLRMDVVDSNVRVTAISPGLVDTEFSIVRFKGDEEKATSVYKGLEALVAEDIAEAVFFAATRPPHVQIADMIIFPTKQASATIVHRKKM